MTTRIDLHTHSTASDGSYTPAELISYAVEKGLSAIALTDHDTIDGIAEAQEKARELTASGQPIELIPGIEFSTEYEGRDIHIVGLFLDTENEFLNRRLKHFKESRKKRNLEMCRRLTRDGFDLTYAELCARFPDGVITRAHFARLLHEKGYVKSVQEAFDRYVGDGKPYFVPRRKISPLRAVEIIRRAGGFPVLAHPVLYHLPARKLDALTALLTGAGLMGIEAVYSTYSAADERDIRRLALKYNLAVSGGSDFHGKAKPQIDLGTGLGKLFLPEDILTTIKERHQAMLRTNASYRLPKILFTDLDETLLRTDKTISAYTFEVLQRFSEAGHILVLNSGRDKNSIYQVYLDLGLDRLQNVCIVGYDGGEIYDCDRDEILYKVTIPLEDVRYLEEQAVRFCIHLHAYSETHIIAHSKSEELSFYQRTIKTPVIFSEHLADAMDEGPCKCLAVEIKDKARLDAFRDALLPWAKEHQITLLYSSDRLMEIFPSCSGKGTAVRILTELLRERSYPETLCTIAAGDQQNDVSMLDAADVAIAMVNGIDAVKDAASTITEFDNNHDGLARVLEDLI